MFFSQEANTSLVRACWNELFTLGLAQCAHVMNLSTILAAIINHLQSSIQNGTTHSTGLDEGFHMGARGQSINICDNNNLIEMLFCLYQTSFQAKGWSRSWSTFGSSRSSVTAWPSWRSTAMNTPTWRLSCCSALVNLLYSISCIVFWHSHKII